LNRGELLLLTLESDLDTGLAVNISEVGSDKLLLNLEVGIVGLKTENAFQ
jgi:hypothetical protein